MTPNSTHTIWQEKYPTCISLKTLSPWLPKFHLFHSSISRFPDIPDFRTFKLPALFWKKCTKWTQNDLGMLENKSIPCACHMHPPPQGPNFQPLCSTRPFFELWPNLWEKCRVTPKWPRLFDIKSTHVRSTYSPENYIFLGFPLRWAIFKKI